MRNRPQSVSRRRRRRVFTPDKNWSSDLWRSGGWRLIVLTYSGRRLYTTQLVCGWPGSIQRLAATCIDPTSCYTGPDYDEWVAVGRPESWCNPRQCEGDASGGWESNPFTGESWWVGVDDLGCLIAGWKQQKYTNPQECWWIAADFSHSAEVNPFTGESWRVGVDDLNILVANWKWDRNIKGDCLER